MPTDSFAHPHFQHLAHLLALETEAEQRRLRDRLQKSRTGHAERGGNSLVQLTVRDLVSGLGGRVLVTLGKRNHQASLPWTRLRVGSPIQLTVEADPTAKAATAPSWRGVVSQLRRDTIQVALSVWPNEAEEQVTLRVDLAGDEIARQRELMALGGADRAKEDRLAELRQILLGESEALTGPISVFEPFDPQLNQPQLESVAHALAAKDVAIIHGPPGTGKTTTVIELIRQAVARGERVLACAPSNLAVDNLLERLVAAPELRAGAVLRIGHPARVLPQLREHTLEEVAENHADMKVVRKLTKEAHALRANAAKFTRAKPLPGERKEKRAEAKALMADARRIEEQMVEQLLDGAQVICGTLTGLAQRILGERHFDLCVIDEAAQSTEPSCWIPLRYCQRLVLAGDHQQLPPTVISREAERTGLGVSLMERLIAETPNLAKQLTVQYRMHEEIMAFSSRTFYGDTLIAHEDVQSHLLTDLPQVAELPLTTTALHFIDTAGADYTETVEEDGKSRYNEQEAALVVQKVGELIEAGLAPTQISVVTPYAAQVRRLRELFEENGETEVEIGTIDGMQGREQEAIIISLVRSNRDGEIGFLADIRRMNVALTRARRKLIIMGNSATIGGDPFYAALLDYIEQLDSYHTVWEEPDSLY